AFVVSPWLTFKLFRRTAEKMAEGPAEHDAETASETRFLKLYQGLFRPLLEKAWRRWTLLGAVAIALLLSTGLVAMRVVKVKMLPFDNKSELQVVIDMPEGSTLEETAGIARRLAETVRTLPEVTDVQIYVGTSAPFNFNGLVRHYFLRSGPLVADLQVNLLPKHHRDRASHPFAKELRDLLAPVVEGTDANVKVTEVPPGPPVLSTMVAEIYGPDLDQRLLLARQVRDIFETTPGIVDIDWWVENPGPQVEFEVDREKAVRAGTTPEAIVRTLRVALEGAEVGLLRDETAREPVPLVLRLDRAQRSSIEGLLGISVHGSEGRMVPLGELVRVRPTSRERFIYHKNLQPVTYVIAEMAGAEESPIYGILDMQDRAARTRQPEDRSRSSPPACPTTPPVTP
ncbi:MAG: AcrB/AcrD/AcrF family protein, partial [Nitrospirae bacterium]|nr:AcrB/AcrD/AcrF family protein [Nitrospirota bacterium]